MKEILAYLQIRFLQGKDQTGVTTVEYAIMLGLVALGVALGAPNIKQAVLDVFTSTSDALGKLK